MEEDDARGGKNEVSDETGGNHPSQDIASENILRSSGDEVAKTAESASADNGWGKTRSDDYDDDGDGENSGEMEEEEEEGTRRLPSSTSTAPGEATASAHQNHSMYFASLPVFRMFMKRNKDGSVDAAGVATRECFEYWCATRRSMSTNPEKAFQRALCAHLTGRDGRIPFSEVSRSNALIR